MSNVSQDFSFRYKPARWLIFIAAFFSYLYIYTQENEHYRIAFYNVENLFDTKHDTLKRDLEYVEGGPRHWNKSRFYKKINGLAKVITALGQWDGLTAVGLCEVENKYVINKLLYHPLLKKNTFRAIQYSSPDKRGIQNVFLYDTTRVKIFKSCPVPVSFPFDTASKTRDILYVKAGLAGDTLHFFINHWPSNYEGFMNSNEKRRYVASLLRSKADSILKVASGAKIIIMGDLNESTEGENISKILGAGTAQDTVNTGRLFVNLMAEPSFSARGTHKYHGIWDILDHIIVSKPLFDATSGLRIKDNKAAVFSAEFLLEKDDKYLGEKPFRTYSGFRYKGGFSDHLPVYIDLEIVPGKQ